MRDVTGAPGCAPQAPLHDTQPSELGRCLRAMRREQGLPLAQTAAAAGLSRLWATQIERGELLDLETVQAYARALGARLVVGLEYDHR
ncbi:helix-turn-helix domain-containing protein [Streptomyces tendae]|uniref:helix-turn-helix domain-containing protein n=1 Tax=Streptomyces tendae TaxID=1932 RepID=UPI0037AB3C5E